MIAAPSCWICFFPDLLVSDSRASMAARLVSNCRNFCLSPFIMVKALLSSLRGVPIGVHIPDQFRGIPKICDSTGVSVPPRSLGLGETDGIPSTAPVFRQLIGRVMADV